MNEAASFFLGVIILILLGVFKLFVWLFKIIKKYFIQYREKIRNSQREVVEIKNKL